jgi:hypothetical protein
MTLANSGGAALRLNDGGFEFQSNSDVEGLFTPTAFGTTAAGTATYTKRYGNYTKIGKRVFFNIALSWSGHTGTGDLKISGLPFTSDSASENSTAITVLNSGVAVTAGSVLSALLIPRHLYKKE